MQTINKAVLSVPVQPSTTMALWVRFLLLGGFLTLSLFTRAQNLTVQDSIVQINGIVLSKDRLKALPSVSVIIQGTKRGMVTNERGGFGVVALLGQTIEFSSVGYKTQTLLVTEKLKNSQQALVEILEPDTTYMASQVINGFPNRAQFDRNFASTKVSLDAQELAMKNLDHKTLTTLSKSVPTTSQEIANSALRKQAYQMGTANQVPDLVGVNLMGLFGKKKKPKDTRFLLDSTSHMRVDSTGHLIIDSAKVQTIAPKD
jgi:hypothetical protein